jgi:hypothetical protein
MKKSREGEKPPKSPDKEKAVPVPSRLGFMKGQVDVPEDFDRMAEDEIAELFGLQRSQPK